MANRILHIVCVFMTTKYSHVSNSFHFFYLKIKHLNKIFNHKIHENYRLFFTCISRETRFAHTSRDFFHTNFTWTFSFTSNIYMWCSRDDFSWNLLAALLLNWSYSKLSLCGENNQRFKKNGPFLAKIW